jgi:transposase-like protein
MSDHGRHGEEAPAAPFIRSGGQSGEWVKQAERDAGTGDGGLTSDERQELAELRRENRRLREDVDILKRATALFALMP